MSTETVTKQVTKQKFNPGDRIVEDLNKPEWAPEDRQAMLIKRGVVIEYRKYSDSSATPLPFVEWDNGQTGFAHEGALYLATSTDNSTEVASDDAIAVPAVEVEPAEPAERLSFHEGKIIQSRQQLMVSVAIIRDENLWEIGGYSSFANYCEKRWGWKKSSAYEMASGGAVVSSLLESGIPESEIPESASAVNQLAKAGDVQQQATVLEETQARDGKVTAKGIEKTLRHTPSVALIIALFSQLGTVEQLEPATHPERLVVTGPLFEEPLTFKTVKEAQRKWELEGQMLCSLAVSRRIAPAADAKDGFCRIPVRITSSGRDKEIGKLAYTQGGWHEDATDPRNNKPSPWTYAFQIDGSPYLKALHLFQVKVIWKDTYDWQPQSSAAERMAEGMTDGMTDGMAESRQVSAPATSIPSSAAPATGYAADDVRGQQKSAIARNLPAMAPFPSGAYTLIVADPAWRYSLREHDATHRGRTPYPTMSDEEILSLPMRQLAADNSYILLWVTNAHLPLALDCLAVWGYKYKNIHTWVKRNGESGKTQIGLGHYGRNCTEHYLVGIKGTPGAWSSLGLTDIPTVIYEGRKEHSKKPSQFWETAQALKAKLGGNAIELFSRSDREGWDSWGLEA